MNTAITARRRACVLQTDVVNGVRGHYPLAGHVLCLTVLTVSWRIASYNFPYVLVRLRRLPEHAILLYQVPFTWYDSFLRIAPVPLIIFILSLPRNNILSSSLPR